MEETCNGHDTFIKWIAVVEDSFYPYKHNYKEHTIQIGMHFESGEEYFAISTI